MKPGLIVAVIAAVFLFGSCAVGFSWYGDAVDLETATTAQYRSNQNEYDSFWKSVTEVAQVPSKYKDDFKDVLIGDTTAKYGANGSQAAVQWFTDRDVKLDPALYSRVQTVIEAGRNSFKRGQNDLLDRQRRYSSHLRAVTGKLLGGFLGFPSDLAGDLRPPKDIDGDGKYTALDYDIVTSGKTKAAFATGEDEAVDVFGRKK